MNSGWHLVEPGAEEPDAPPGMSRLFHRLNNQLGIVLAHAEMLEERAVDEAGRRHAAQIVSSVLDALSTSREIRRRSETGDQQGLGS